MKKFFTLIAAVVMAASANAQTTEWNFSDWDATNITENTVKDGLTVYASSDKPITIDANKKTVDDVTYTQRLKLGGSGAVTDLSALSRVLSFDVTGPCDIYVVAAHASSSGDDRALKFDAVVDDAATNFGEMSLAAKETKSATIKYTGSAAKILIYSAKSGINLYDVKVTTGTTGIKDVKAAANADEAATYNMAGQKVGKNYKGIVIKNGKKTVQK